MYTLLISIALLLLGYVFYGRFVEKVFAPSATSLTPAFAVNDGVDYVPMPTWKVIMIQFLNIAGTGPIFGAILGAMYGPACFFWIVFGCIFGGAVHDYFTGMLSVRENGAGLPELIGKYLGVPAKRVIQVFVVLVLMLVCAVFVYSPAIIIGDMIAPDSTTDDIICVVVIMLYYIIATLISIDKVIGRIYPLFAAALLFMAVALFVCLVGRWPSELPEVWDGLANRNPGMGSMFPCMFISIACGAVSGFHATQSPMMARCIRNENKGRSVFYGSMILEGIIALIWASVSSWFFFAGGNVELGAEGVKAAPAVVTTVSKGWLGGFGAVLAILGVVVAPITSGDTALRSCRLIVAEAFGIEQKPIRKRLLVCVPIVVVTTSLLLFNILNAHGFDLIWRYFGWANQSLSVFAFWAATVFLVKYRKGMYYLITMIPALFMTAVCVSFILTAKIGFNMPDATIPYISAITVVASLVVFRLIYPRLRSKNN
ncbi:MAG: carbon starvation protein A [Bacteroidales bacterium]|nr:carbon starvation protein A [Bacteroidales bacterium]